MSTNFLVWNPTQSNQENDAEYLADPQRAGGAAVDAIYPSALHNKLAYQLSTFVTAFCQMLVGKGYSPNDASLSVLAALLANVITNADLATLDYLTVSAFVAAQPFSPSIGGTGATSLNNAKISNRVGQYDITGHSGSLTAQVVAAAVPAGRYLVLWEAYKPSGGLGTALDVCITWTQGGTSHTVTDFPNLATSDGECDAGSVAIFPDAGTDISISQTLSPAGSYDLHAWVEAQ